MRLLLNTVKYVLIALLALIVLLVIVIKLVDLNGLKPVLQNKAAQYGATLELPGSLGWQFYPNFGLKLGAMELKRADDGEQLAAIEAAGLTLKWLPLLSGQININGINLDGMQARYLVDAQGQSNWQPLLEHYQRSQEPTAAPRDKTETEADQAAYSELPAIEINKFSINDLSLQYSNAQAGTQMTLSKTDVALDQFSLDGLPAQLSLNTHVDYAPYPTMVLDWQGQITVDQIKRQAAVKNGKGELKVAGKSMSLTLDTSAAWAAPELSATGSLTLQTEHFKKLLAALEIQLPPTADSEVLQALSLAVDFALEGEDLSLDPMVLKLDETRIQGDFKVESFSQPVITSNWHGTRLNLDRYLPPSDEQEATGSSSPSPQEPPQRLPFDLLQALQAELQFDFEEITYNALALLYPKIKLKGDDGLITLQELSAEVTKGQAQGQGVFDARNEPAQLNMTLDLTQFNVADLLKSQLEFDHLSGNADVALTLTSSGSTDTELLDNLLVQSQSESDSLKLTPINIEEQFCRALAVLQREPLPDHNWADETLFEPIRVAANYHNGQVTLESLSSELAKMRASGEGKLDTEPGKFDFALSLSLADFGETLPGCIPIKDSWRERALPIRCKGTLESIGAKTCLPDERVLKQWLQGKVKTELKKERRKQEEDLKGKAKDLLQKELGEDKAQEAEEKLKDLFDKFKK